MDKNPNLIRVENTIINFANVTAASYMPHDISIAATVPGAPVTVSERTSLKLNFVGGSEQNFKGRSAASLWTKLVSLAESVTVPPADKE